jgi:spermidine/putrescine transport system permease protein
VLFFLPITLPGLFLGLSLLVMFNRIHLTLSLYTVGAAHWIYVLPYFVLIALQAFASMDPEMEEVARDLGASSWRIFWGVTIPQIWPLLLGATALAFALSFDEFIITFFVIGPDGTLPLYIWSALRRSVDPSINVVSTLLLALSLVLWVIAFVTMVRRESHRRVAVEAELT